MARSKFIEILDDKNLIRLKLEEGTKSCLALLPVQPPFEDHISEAHIALNSRDPGRSRSRV